MSLDRPSSSLLLPVGSILVARVLLCGRLFYWSTVGRREAFLQTGEIRPDEEIETDGMNCKRKGDKEGQSIRGGAIGMREER